MEWSRGVSDSKRSKALFIPWKTQEMTDLIKEYETRIRKHARRGVKFSQNRLTAPNYLLQQTLRTMRPKHAMIENLIECCRFGLSEVGAKPTIHFWVEHRQNNTRCLILGGTLARVEFPIAEAPRIPGFQMIPNVYSPVNCHQSKIRLYNQVSPSGVGCIGEL